MLPAVVERSAKCYLADIDRLVPGAITGFYLVGSVALGAYRERRSDIDFVAVVAGDVGARELRRLRVQHLRSGVRTSGLALRQRRSPLTGACNGVFIRQSDLTRPVGEITPIAAHVGRAFTMATAGYVSPVEWKVLAERGIPIRGPEPSALQLDQQPERLCRWNLENLESYWRPWAMSTSWSSWARFRMRPRWSTAWAALGVPRLHCTIATGKVVSKEAAGEYALDEFPNRFHSLIDEALAFWREEPTRLDLSPKERRLHTAEFVLEVIDSARVWAVTAAFGGSPE